MIDKIHLSSIIDHLVLKTIEASKDSDGLSFKTVNVAHPEKYMTFVQEEDYSYYYHWYKQIQIRYYPAIYRLDIRGRLVNLSEHSNRVDNLDEYYKGFASIDVKQDHSDGTVKYTVETYITDLDGLILNLNNEIEKLLGVKVDILSFKVRDIELCFNVIDENASRYIELFNLCFKKDDPARYKNFTFEKDRPLYSSFYIKSNSQYEKNINTTYTVNFYNKYDQICNELNKYYAAIDKEAKRLSHLKNKKGFKSKIPVALPFSVEDFTKSKNDLRLEVKCFYERLSKISKKNSISNKERPFSDFINIDLSMNEVTSVYESFIGDKDLDFYSYAAAKKKIEESDGKTLKFLKFIKGFSRKPKKDETDDYYIGRLKKLGIHWCFIPTKWNIDYLESPIKLLYRQVEQTKVDKENFAKRANLEKLTAKYSNEITVEDDSKYIVVSDS